MTLNVQNRQQLLTILALAALALWLGDKLLVTPLSAAWRDRNARLADLRKSVSEGRQLIDRERAVRARWQSMRTNMLPSSVSEAEGRIFQAFDQWSRDSRMTITSITPQWKQNEDYSTLEFRIEGSGTMQAITRFLYEIEKAPMALKMEFVDLRARTKDGSEIDLTLLVSGVQLTPTER